MSCVMCTRWDDLAPYRIAEFEESYLILNPDQFFPGYCLLFTKEHQTELFHLPRERRIVLMDEVTQVAEALFNLYQPAKINYELLGNMVPHIHWHLVPRFASEPLWPRPIWSEPHEEVGLDEANRTRVIADIRGALRL